MSRSATRWWLLGPAGLLAVLVLVLVAKNVAVRRAILRINEQGGLVTSDDLYLPQRVYARVASRAMGRVESIFVLRDGYDVSFGFIIPSCTRGQTLSMAPEGPWKARNPGEAGLLALRDLPRIKSLTLIDTSVSDEQLRLVRALDGLTVLDLDATPIDGSGLAHLRGMRRLQVLSLARTRVDDAALEALDDLPALELLDLQDTRVRGVALARLSRFTALRDIALQGSLVDDRAIDELEKLPALRSISVCRTSVTQGRLLAAIARRGWAVDVGVYCP